MAYFGYDTKRYGAEVDGHRVELEFDKSLVVLNRVRLLVDGHTVDQGSILYGSTRLHGELPGDPPRPVVVQVGSGWAGQLTEAVLEDGAGRRELQPLA